MVLSRFVMDGNGGSWSLSPVLIQALSYSFDEHFIEGWLWTRSCAMFPMSFGNKIWRKDTGQLPRTQHPLSSLARWEKAWGFCPSEGTEFVWLVTWTAIEIEGNCVTSPLCCYCFLLFCHRYLWTQHFMKTKCVLWSQIALDPNATHGQCSAGPSFPVTWGLLVQRR